MTVHLSAGSTCGGCLGPGAVEVVLDPGRAIVEERLSDQWRTFPVQCGEASENRWYLRVAQWITCTSIQELSTPRTTTRESVQATFRGVLVTYGEQAKDRPDVYEAGSLTWPDGGIVLNEQHDRKQLLKRFSPYLAGDELRVDFPLPPTQRGRDAAYMVRDGTYTGLSVWKCGGIASFRPTGLVSGISAEASS